MKNTQDHINKTCQDWRQVWSGLAQNGKAWACLLARFWKKYYTAR